MVRRVAVAALALAAACSNGAVSVLCPEGTSYQGGACVAASGDGGPQVSCGPGTHLSGNTCLADAVDAGPRITCGAGTHQSGTTCVADPQDAGPFLVCGPGTHQSGNLCVADPQDAGPAIVCGAGTHQSGNTCVPDAQDGGQTLCGAGTHASGLVCLPDDVCGTGTHNASGQCLPDQDGGVVWEARVPTQEIPADGYTKIPVLALAREADGTPHQGDALLGSSRFGAATFLQPQVSVGLMGAQTFLTPCNAIDFGCLGVFQVTLASPGAPGTVLGSSVPITLVAPAGVGSPAACLTGGNVLFFNGDTGDYIHPGVATISAGAWSTTLGPSGAPTDLAIHLTPSGQGNGLWWDLDFSTRQLGVAMRPQTYQDAERAPFASAGHPGIDIGGDGRGCNTIKGRFQLEELKYDSTGPKSVTATFEQHCEGFTAALRGCVHWAAP